MDELLPSSELARIEAEKPALPIAGPLAVKVHTGERMPVEIRLEVINRFAAGESRKSIAHRLGVSRNSIAAVLSEAETSGQIPRARERMARAMEGIIEDHLLSVMERNKELTTVDFAIYYDKWEKATGQATQRIEISVTKEDQSAVLDSLKRLSEGFLDVEATKMADDQHLLPPPDPTTPPPASPES